MRHGLETLEAHGWRADYVVTHCAPTSVQAKLGRDDADALTDYLECIHRQLDYKKWYFGHYHGDREIDGKDALLYCKIEPIRELEGIR